MQDWTLSLIINSLIFIIFFVASIFVIFRLKIEQKGYKLLFVTYLVFWIPFMMTREYTSQIVGERINREYMSLILCSYGLVGIFCRPLVDYLSLILRNRKIILYAAIVVSTITFIPFIAVQTTATSLIQSIGVGIGASMIGMYELMFKEQYTVNKAFMTVSILSIPPLLADFLGSSIQSVITTIPTGGNNPNYPTMYIWIISLAIMLIVFVMLIFIKEDRTKIGLRNKAVDLLNNNKYSYIWFILICLIGFLVAFVKFSNSGSVAILIMNQLNDINPYNEQLINSLKAYMSLLFSLFQLSSCVFIYYFVIKKNNHILLFTIGISSWIIFHLLIMFINNPIVYFSLSPLSGLGYGILYNMILGYVLTISFNTNKITPMGIYQSILSIGTTLSTFVVPFIKINLTNGITVDNNDSFITNNYIVNGILLSMIVLITIMYFVSHFIYSKKQIIKPKRQMLNT